MDKFLGRGYLRCFKCLQKLSIYKLRKTGATELVI